jgi:pimeloyl-ACP methyl ester carboxylesterase
MPIAHLKDADLYYESTGTGNPSLVFIHGFSCDHTDWSNQVKHFSKTNRVITCDLRGHGNSTGTKANCTMEDLGADVCDLMKSLNVGKAVLVGHSMGCRVALETYLQNPRLVTGIVFVDGSQLGKGNPKDIMGNARMAIEKTGYKDHFSNSFGKMFFGDYDVSLKNHVIERVLSLNPDFGTTLSSNMRGWDAAKMETALSAIKVQFLVIQSTGVNASNERYSLKMGDNIPWFNLVKKLVPQARIETVPGHGHWVMIEAPDRTNELIDSFVAQLKTE